MNTTVDVKPSTSHLNGGELDQSFSAECNICTFPFNENDCRPVIRQCGHTVCEQCARKVKNKCPSCQAPVNGRQKFVYNYQLMQQIRNQEEMRDQLKAAKEKSKQAEDELKRLQELANRGSEYNKALKCKECDFPMKEGFFCLDCLVVKTEKELHEMDDTTFQKYCSQCLCGGCLKKHEKKRHATAELEEITKTRQVVQYVKETKDIVKTFNLDFTALAKVLSSQQKSVDALNKKVDRTFKVIEGSSSSSHLQRMEENLQKRLTDLAAQADSLVSQFYAMRESIEFASDAADSIASACGYIEDDEEKERPLAPVENVLQFVSNKGSKEVEKESEKETEENETDIKKEPLNFMEQELESSDSPTTPADDESEGHPVFPTPDEFAWIDPDLQRVSTDDFGNSDNYVKAEPVSFVDNRPSPARATAMDTSDTAGGWMIDSPAPSTPQQAAEAKRRRHSPPTASATAKKRRRSEE